MKFEFEDSKWERLDAAALTSRKLLHPFAPALMLVIAVLLLLGFVYSNPLPSLYALAVLASSYPVFRLIEKRI